MGLWALRSLRESIFDRGLISISADVVLYQDCYLHPDRDPNVR